MTTFTRHVFCNSTSTANAFPTVRNSQRTKPRRICKFPQKGIKTPALKEICRQGNIKEAYDSLGDVISYANPLTNCLDEAYALALELCASQNALWEGRQIHALVLKCSIACDLVFLDTKLVFMYGKCGSLLDAWKVFDAMSFRTVFTWNAMIGACVTNAEYWEALELYREMRLKGVSLDAFTFSCILKATAGLKDLYCGMEIHGMAIKVKLNYNSFVANSLMGMYSKCNALSPAMLLFDRIAEREDVVSWNLAISAHVENGLAIEALGIVRDMRMAGITPSSYTYVAALEACEMLTLAKFGMEIHAAVLKYSHNLYIHVVNALLNMYSRCAKIDKAKIIFSEMDCKDNIAWNSMIAGFVQNGLYNESFQLFHEVYATGQEPDWISIMSMLHISGLLENLQKGMEIHSLAIKNGFDSNLQVANTLIDMYSKCLRIDYAHAVFCRMPKKDLISWTTIIAGCALNNCPRQALEMFRQVILRGIDVDAMMIGSLLLNCGMLKCTSLVKEVHGYVTRRELLDLLLLSNIMDAYVECGDIYYASSTFKKNEMKDVISWTSMISCYVQNGFASEALDLFRSMNCWCVEPDAIALASALSATANLSSLIKGKEIHGYSVRRGFVLEGSIACSLVDMYACCGLVEKAYTVFNHVDHKDTFLWTSMINSCGMHGLGKEAIELFARMENENHLPDHITFLSLQYACSHSALVDEGKRFFKKMQCEYRLEPWSQHYACLVDLLGRANYLEEAFQSVQSMQLEPTPAIWSSLLAACQIHSNKAFGEIAAEKLLELDPNNPANYVLASNVYAAEDKWEAVDKVRMRMKEKGLKKDPACSWIEVKNKVHIFVARDRSHPEAHKIYQELELIIDKLEQEEGYVAQTKYVLQNVSENEKIKMLYGHSEKLAIAYGLLAMPNALPIRIMKNLRICGDCHMFCKLVSKNLQREIIIRDASRFHYFSAGLCSCGDFW